MAAWECDACDVQGRSADAEPRCWNCEGPVLVTARPTVRSDLMREVVTHR